MKKSAHLFLLPGLLFFWVDVALSQAVHYHHHSHPALEAIEKALVDGMLTADEAILQKLYAGLQPEKLHPAFIADDHIPIKCLTPVIQEYYELSEELSNQTVTEVGEMLAGIQGEQLVTSSYMSDSGKFIFYYETEGSHAVPPEDTNSSGIPDYVEKAAVMADSSYTYQVETLGFADFYTGEPYEISFRNIGAYGLTRQSGTTTSIVIHHSFNGFPENTHPEGNQTGALYATIAHELKHASQFISNRWRDGRDWIEMDATMMEEVVHPDVNDYYNYIMNYDNELEWWLQSRPATNSIFARPQSPTPGSYYHVTWMLYFQEVYGIDFWVDAWRVIEDNYHAGLIDETIETISFFEAVQNVLQLRSLTLEQEHVMNHLWHVAAGPFFSSNNFGFEDRDNYPESEFLRTIQMIPDSLDGGVLQPMAANYIEVLPSGLTLGQPAVTVEAGTNGIGIGLIGYFKDGSSDVMVGVQAGAMTQTVQTTWSWADLTDLNVVVVNTNREETANYNLNVTSVVPDGDAIAQNYPNPFNRTTKIGFSLTDRKDVKIEVFDSMGRKVSTLVDGRLNRGFHNVIFDTAGLASGIYIYRIITDDTILTRKMVLIK